MKGEKLL